MRILIAEDEKDLNKIISRCLSKEGYVVDSCYNGKEAMLCLATGEFDLVILDIMMPEKSGLEVLREIRENGSRLPVLFLTAKDSVEDKVLGLDTGADDYMVKPFSLEELLARIRAIIRKSAGFAENKLRFEDLTVDIRSRRVFRGEKEIILTGKEFDVLEYMIRNQGVILSREKIENHVWNFEYTGGTNVVDVYIRYLRKKIDDGYQRKLIQTVRGTGYVIR